MASPPSCKIPPSRFDVNSLYPSSMKKYPMPVGKPKHFTGNPYLFDSNPFGFFKVKVSAPSQLKILNCLDNWWCYMLYRLSKFYGYVVPNL